MDHELHVRGMVVDNLGAVAGEDLEGKGMKLLLSTSRSLVLVQPGEEAWHSCASGPSAGKQGEPIAQAWAAKCRKHEALFCSA